MFILANGMNVVVTFTLVSSLFLLWVFVVGVCVIAAGLAFLETIAKWIPCAAVGAGCSFWP